MLNLKATLTDLDQRQITLAKHLNVSSATVSLLINHRQWPRTIDQDDLRKRIEGFLKEHGADDVAVNTAFEEMEPERANAKAPANPTKKAIDDQECEPMLLRKQVLLPETKRAFAIFRDPFDDLQCVEDMYVNPDIRYIRESMYQVARHDGFLAVVGESGAGKSTLRRDLINRLNAEGAPVLVIEPYVLAMEDKGEKGKALRTSHIADAIVDTVAPLERPKSNPEARFRQMHRALKNSYESGFRHVLIIEEAHSMPISTLKHLKRLRELESGFTKLVSIILIGQTELMVKLSERNAEVREVVQRIEVAELLPVSAARLGEFLAFRMDRAGKKLAEVIDPSGVQAIAERLTNAGRDTKRSLLYPLAIGNLVVAAMNLATSIGAPLITDEVIKGV
ncbi:transposase [Pseudomonas sp. HMWF032]|uniref:ExeA family protein n=1 Tax=Pseudomonas sp. HMWF032 TaxID=2056866 RepID=UPI000D3C9256|nr:AAA family ATPase [Pseudomonas sp. HMWF032]PTS85515.1 transposase [Pseudomonas sp. HMWF032]PTT82270.1 transposase [Pseudomonas sp. HMWF010]